MITLWVDCDDTLVLYEQEAPNPFGMYIGDKWQPNTRLIEAVEKWNGRLVVWSGGGKDYASTCAKTLGLRPDRAEGKSRKMMRRVQPGDIVVDDQPIRTAGTTLTWEEFVGGPEEPEERSY